MVNISKLFRRLSITKKLVIAFVLIGIIPLSVVGSYGAFFSFSLLSEHVLDHVKRTVTIKAEEIQGFLSGVKEDLLYLSQLPTLHEVIDLPEDGNRVTRQSLVHRLGSEFLGFSRAHQAYYQVRYIDEHGKEIVRADFDGSKSYLVPPHQLQDKSHRYYFREAMQVRPSDTYVSPMDLNIERGVVEVPHKPVVRYATPIVNSRGEQKGIVIINLYASHILGQILRLRQDEGGTVFLANNEGVYLSHFEEANAGARDPRLAAQETLEGDYSKRIATQILSGEPGAVVERGLTGKIVAFAPIFPYLGEQQKFWVIAQAYDKAEVLSSIRSLRFLVLGLGGFVLVIAIVVGIAAARHFTKPILELSRGAEIVAGGNFESSVKVETNDELEDLAYRFNLMTQKLKEHERQLKSAHERLEMKAREAEALYKIGTEISAFLELDKILYLVVDKARELLASDVAALCLLDAHEQEMYLAATSGPPDAFSLERGEKILDGLGRGCSCTSPMADGELKVCTSVCPGIRDQYVKSCLAAPLRTRDKLIGALCVGTRALHQYTERDAELLSALASQAAIAIENATLHGQVRNLAALEERERISKDLHDGIIQGIYATGLGLEDGIQLVDEDPLKAKQRLEHAIEDLNDVIKDVRNYIFNLQPKVLHGKNIAQAMADLVKGFRINSLIDADLVADEAIDALLSQEQKTNLFHVTQEALANVAKHAQASQVRLELLTANQRLVLSINDNGVGFDPGKTSAQGQGLRNMANRVKVLEGDLAIESAIGRGTHLVVTIPLRDTEGGER